MPQARESVLSECCMMMRTEIVTRWHLCESTTRLISTAKHLAPEMPNRFHHAACHTAMSAALGHHASDPKLVIRLFPTCCQVWQRTAGSWGVCPWAGTSAPSSHAQAGCCAAAAPESLQTLALCWAPASVQLRC